MAPQQLFRMSEFQISNISHTIVLTEMIHIESKFQALGCSIRYSNNDYSFFLLKNFKKFCKEVTERKIVDQCRKAFEALKMDDLHYQDDINSIAYFHRALSQYFIATCKVSTKSNHLLGSLVTSFPCS